MSKYNYTIHQVQEALDNSNSISAVLRYLGYEYVSCPHHRKYLNNLIEENDLSLEKYKQNQKEKHPFDTSDQTKLTVEEVVSTKKRRAAAILTRILKESGREYKCEECGVEGIYNNKPLTLQVDHIDGDPTNNVLSNLRFLCPNCHTQTKNYGSKNAKRKPNKLHPDKVEYTCKCGAPKTRRAKVCDKCNRSKIEWPSDDELSKMVSSMPMTKVAECLGVSDNGVRKRCKQREINFKKRY